MPKKWLASMSKKFEYVNNLDEQGRLRLLHKVWRAISENNVGEFCRLLLEKKYDDVSVEHLAFSKKGGKRILETLLARPDTKMLNYLAKCMPYLIACDLFWSEPLGKSFKRVVTYCLERNAVGKFKGLFKIVEALGKQQIPAGPQQLPWNLRPDLLANALNCMEKGAYGGLKYCLKKDPFAVLKR